MISKGPMAVAIVVLALVVVVTVPVSDGVDGADSSDTMDFKNFLEAVASSDYIYDGNNVTVEWSPTSGCTSSEGHSNCLFKDKEYQVADGNTPQRIQEPNAQYQIFSGETDVSISDVSISNVKFVFVPADFTLCTGSAWGGEASLNTIRNAEFQFLNTGNLTFTDCTFDKVIVSPFSCEGTTTITRCTFENVYDAYAIKDIRSENAEITGCTFDNCSGGIYFEGDNTKGTYTITGNTFTNMDKYAAADKIGTRGLVQFSKAGDYGNAIINITGNESDGSASVFRLLNVTLNKDTLENLMDDNDFKSIPFTGDSNVATVSVDGVPYTSISTAFENVIEGSEITILRSFTIGSWEMIWNIKGVTIDGGNNTLTINAISSGQNDDALFHSAGGNTFKNMTIDLSGIVSDSQAQGNRAFSAAPEDVFQNVTIIGNEHVSYGITVGGTDVADETVTIEDCRFENMKYGVYDSETGDVENLVITGSEFTGCNYAVILHSKFAEFVGNDVSGGKVNILDNAQKVTDNSFTDRSRIKFYTAGPTFERNSISGDSFLASDEDVSGIDVSENYWGGGAPTQSQLGEIGATYVDFYLDEGMTSLNTDPVPGYEEDDELPPFIPQQSAEDDDTTLYIACCAAAAVVALLAIIIVMNERKR